MRIRNAVLFAGALAFATASFAQQGQGGGQVGGGGQSKAGVKAGIKGAQKTEQGPGQGPQGGQRQMLKSGQKSQATKQGPGQGPQSKMKGVAGHKDMSGMKGAQKGMK